MDSLRCQYILITNHEVLNNFNSYRGCQFEVIQFNPWGFSKIGIENQILQAISVLPPSENCQILFFVTDCFFGNRSKIAFNTLKNYFPKKEIFEFKSLNELNLFLDNSSV